jgi:hypothetical protein
MLRVRERIFGLLRLLRCVLVEIIGVIASAFVPIVVTTIKSYVPHRCSQVVNHQDPCLVHQRRLERIEPIRRRRRIAQMFCERGCQGVRDFE